jgi:hypothetical protein
MACFSTRENHHQHCSCTMVADPDPDLTVVHIIMHVTKQFAEVIMHENLVVDFTVRCIVHDS